LSKYDSDRDEILDALVAQGWANQSTGSVESPIGHVAIVCNRPQDIVEIAQAFSDEIAVLSADEPEFDPMDLVGNFVVRTDTYGFVTVTEYNSPVAASDAYDRAEEAYAEWLGAEDGESQD
jgi:hypothetical protein